MIPPLVKIGFVSKSFGAEGLMNLVVEEIYQPILTKLSFIFIDIDHCKIPFKVKKIKVGHNILLRLEDVDQPEKTSLFKTKSIFIEKEWLKEISLSKDEIKLSNCTGFKVFDVEGDLKGVITAINESSGNVFANVLFNGNDLLIPLHQDLVSDFNITEQSLILDYPFE